MFPELLYITIIGTSLCYLYYCLQPDERRERDRDARIALLLSMITLHAVGIISVLER